MKMLLVVPPSIKDLFPLIPIGLLYIGAVLDKNSINYDFFDLNFSSNYELVLKIEKFKPDFVGITIRNIAETSQMNNIYQSICNIVNIAQRYSKVILGGAGFSIFSEQIINFTGADYGIVGPGESAIIYLINNFHKIPGGSILKKYDDTFVTSDTTNAMKKYWKKYGKYFFISKASIPIQTTRGCIYSCSYCTYPMLSNYSIQNRPINRIVKELKEISISTKRDFFYFVDSIFNMDLDYTKKFLMAIIDSKTKIKWSCCINPVHYDEEMIKLMKKSGCVHCEVGIDSFSDRQLTRLHKSFNAKQAKQLLKELEKNDLSYTIALLLGGVGETKSSLLETLREVKSFKSAKINAFIGTRIYPGTSLEKMINTEKINLWKSDCNSIYVENSVVPILKSVVQNALPERWSFTGGEL